MSAHKRHVYEKSHHCNVLPPELLNVHVVPGDSGSALHLWSLVHLLTMSIESSFYNGIFIAFGGFMLSDTTENTEN